MWKPLKIKDFRTFFVYRKNSFVIARAPNSRKLRWNQHTCTISADRLKTVDDQSLERISVELSFYSSE